MAGRIAATAAAFIGLVLGAAAISLGGQAIIAREPPAEFVADVTLDPEMEELARQAAEPETAVDTDAPTGQIAEPEAAPVQTAVPTENGGYQRIEPRAPLSEIGMAQPPKRKRQAAPEDWKSTRLFNPVASAAGIVEAQGHRLALAGIDPVPVDETCVYETKSWPCGARARTAFRAWLRARAIQCKVPPEPDRELITAECFVGKEDLAEWLVVSGWARPSADGAYVEAGKKAQAEKKGIYGAPPARINMVLPPALLPVEEPADIGEPDPTPESGIGLAPVEPPSPSQ